MVGDYRGSFIHRISDDSEHSDDASSLETSSMVNWTDEKHSLYLKSMEASFIDQLYNSLSSNPNKETVEEIRSSRKFGSKPCDDEQKSPWIKHYTPLPKTLHNSVTYEHEMFFCSLLRQGSSHLRHRDQEVSDQNFVNQVTKGENGSLKKMKTVTSTDQVVPIRILKHDIKY